MTWHPAPTEALAPARPKRRLAWGTAARTALAAYTAGAAFATIVIAVWTLVS